MTTKRILILVFISTLFTSCIFDKVKDNANAQFGDQNFKTAISLIELYKIREGKYPESLDSLKYIGDWDKMAINSVSYKKLENGYQLDLINGWIGKPNNLKYPVEFWKGIGLKKSNLKIE